MPEIKWISFHSSYDFGYFLKLLTCAPLPSEETDFFDLLSIFFPNFYDIKYMMKACKSLKGGLQDIADDLGLVRIGTQHQAGSDSLLTCNAFFKIRHMFFEDHIDDSKFQGILYGIGNGAEPSLHNKPVTSGPINNPFMNGVFGNSGINIGGGNVGVGVGGSIQDNSGSSILFGTTPPPIIQ